MDITIYRGTKEIGGTLIEIKTNTTRLLVDAGYPLFLNNMPIEDSIAKLPEEELRKLGVLPPIHGLYNWDVPAFDAVIVSHAHIDHYGLLKYVHPTIPIYLSAGTQKLITLSQLFNIVDNYPLNAREFKMYEAFSIGDIQIKPYLIDHSAFDAAAFEISAEDKIVIYTGDFRGHGRKAICLERFISQVAHGADVLFIEGTMFGRQYEQILSEYQLENEIVDIIKNHPAPVLFQSSSQNIDRLVSFYRASLKSDRLFVIDVYTANVLYELRQLGNRLPYPSIEYPNIKVFYPYYLTQKIFKQIGEVYAKRFSAFHISKDRLKEVQNQAVMLVRPSMIKDIARCDLQNGIFIYSLWQGYRDSQSQNALEKMLKNAGFIIKLLHTSGHASIVDIRRVITALVPKKIVPIHTMVPDSFLDLSTRAEMQVDGIPFEV